MEGLRTTYGSPIFRDFVPEADCAMVANLRRAGAVILGKTNTPEFGAGANTRNTVHGATGNPFDPTKSAAGSSGGSAVALAAGMVPLCSGSDTGGSLRNPAAFCGIVGYRPSSGLVPSEKRGHGWSNLPVLGPMARNVPDTCLMLSAMASDDGRDPLAYTLPGGRCAGARAVLAAGAGRPGGAAAGVHARFRRGADREAGTRASSRCVWRPSRRCSPAPRKRARIAAVGTRRSRCCGRRASSLAWAEGARAPAGCGPNILANVEEGLRLYAGGHARAATSRRACIAPGSDSSPGMTC